MTQFPDSEKFIFNVLQHSTKAEMHSFIIGFVSNLFLKLAKQGESEQTKYYLLQYDNFVKNNFVEFLSNEVIHSSNETLKFASILASELPSFQLYVPFKAIISIVNSDSIPSEFINIAKCYIVDNKSMLSTENIEDIIMFLFNSQKIYTQNDDIILTYIQESVKEISNDNPNQLKKLSKDCYIKLMSCITIIHSEISDMDNQKTPSFDDVPVEIVEHAAWLILHLCDHYARPLVQTVRIVQSITDINKYHFIQELLCMICDTHCYFETENSIIHAVHTSMRNGLISVSVSYRLFINLNIQNLTECIDDLYVYDLLSLIISGNAKLVHQLLAKIELQPIDHLILTELNINDIVDVAYPLSENEKIHVVYPEDAHAILPNVNKLLRLVIDKANNVYSTEAMSQLGVYQVVELLSSLTSALFISKMDTDQLLRLQKINNCRLQIFFSGSHKFMDCSPFHTGEDIMNYFDTAELYIGNIKIFPQQSIGSYISYCSLIDGSFDGLIIEVTSNPSDASINPIFLQKLFIETFIDCIYFIQSSGEYSELVQQISTVMKSYIYDNEINIYMHINPFAFIEQYGNVKQLPFHLRCDIIHSIIGSLYDKCNKYGIYPSEQNNNVCLDITSETIFDEFINNLSKKKRIIPISENGEWQEIKLYEIIAEHLYKKCLNIDHGICTIHYQSAQASVIGLGCYIANCLIKEIPSKLQINDLSRTEPHISSFWNGFTKFIPQELVYNIFNNEEIKNLFMVGDDSSLLFKGGSMVPATHFDAKILELKQWNNHIEALTELSKCASLDGFELRHKRGIQNPRVTLNCNHRGCSFSLELYRIDHKSAIKINSSQTHLYHNHTLNQIPTGNFFSDSDLEEIYKNYNLHRNYAMLGQFIIEKYGCNIPNDNLHNVIAKCRRKLLDNIDMLIEQFNIQFGKEGYCKPLVINHDNHAVLFIDPSEINNLNQYGQVIWIDPTFCKIESPWKIIPLTVLGRYKELLPAGIAFVESNDSETFQFIIQVLKCELPSGKEFVTLVSDDDSGIGKAMQFFINHSSECEQYEECSSIKRMLCSWHRRTIIQSELSRLRVDKDTIEEVKTLFNNMIYTRSNDVYEYSYNTLCKKHPFIHGYLNKNQNSIRMMARTKIGDVLTLGYTTSSLAESHNSLIKRHIPKGRISMTILYKSIQDSHLELETQHYKMRADNDKISVMYNDINIATVCSVSTVIAKEIRCQLLLIASCTVQKHNNDHYSVQDGSVYCRNKKTIYFEVRNIDGLLRCSCKKFEQEGIICAHIFACRQYDNPGCNLLTPIFCHKRWQFHQGMNDQSISLTLQDHKMNEIPPTDITAVKKITLSKSDKLTTLKKQFFSDVYDIINIPIGYDFLLWTFKSMHSFIHQKSDMFCQICGSHEHDIKQCHWFADFERFCQEIQSQHDNIGLQQKKCSICNIPGHTKVSCPTLTRFHEKHPEAICLQLLYGDEEKKKLVIDEFSQMQDQVSFSDISFSTSSMASQESLPAEFPSFEKTYDDTQIYMSQTISHQLPNVPLYKWWGNHCYALSILQILGSSLIFLTQLEGQKGNAKQLLFEFESEENSSQNECVGMINQIRKKIKAEHSNQAFYLLLTHNINGVCFQRTVNEKGGADAGDFLICLLLHIFGYGDSRFQVEYRNEIDCSNCVNIQSSSIKQTYMLHAQHTDRKSQILLSDFFERGYKTTCQLCSDKNALFKHTLVNLPTKMLFVRVVNVIPDEYLSIRGRKYRLIGISMFKNEVHHYICILIEYLDKNYYWTIDSVGANAVWFVSLESALKECKNQKYEPTLAIYEIDN